LVLGADAETTLGFLPEDDVLVTGYVYPFTTAQDIADSDYGLTGALYTEYDELPVIIAESVTVLP
jgi:hypothetical protein